MKVIKYENCPFNKFYLKDLFTNKLIECSQDDFEEIVIRFRSMYEMKYDGPNKQLFLQNGTIEAARERI